MVAASFLLAGVSLLAQDQTQSRIHDPALDQTRLQTPIYGTPLMTNTEIALYRSQLSALKTPQERDAYVQAHQTLMQARAAEKGLTLLGTPAGPGKAGAATAGPAGASAGKSGSAGSGSGSSGGSGGGSGGSGAGGGAGGR